MLPWDGCEYQWQYCSGRIPAEQREAFSIGEGIYSSLLIKVAAKYAKYSITKGKSTDLCSRIKSVQMALL